MKTCFALSLGFILCIYSSWGDYEHGWIWRSAVAAACKCQFWTIRGLKNDIFDWDQCKIRYIYVKKKRTKWGKKWMEISAIKRGGLGPTLNGKCHKNFPYLFNPSLIHTLYLGKHYKHQHHHHTSTITLHWDNCWRAFQEDLRSSCMYPGLATRVISNQSKGVLLKPLGYYQRNPQLGCLQKESQ